MKFPEHKASLHLTHNEHKSVYHTVRQAIDDGDWGTEDDCWISPEQKQLAIDTDEMWTLQWYPDTPIGFYVMSAADLGALLEAALNHKE